MLANIDKDQLAYYFNNIMYSRIVGELRGPFNTFIDFVVQAFKIVADS